jgi:hypothetical protein
MMERLSVAFLSSCSFEKDAAIRGGILITDEQTKPLEFRVTAPVRPTNFQRTLYGDILMEHILVELVTVPLLSALSQKPDVIVVRDPLFLGANERQSIPLVRVFKDGEIRFAGSNKAEQLSSNTGKYEPILIETSKSLDSRLPEFRGRLADVFAQRSLLEPFDRILTALQQVHSQKTGE